MYLSRIGEAAAYLGRVLTEQVHVIQARGLPVADIVGTSDAFVELTTDGKHVVSTPVIPDNVNP
eukprot:scaffold124022_cov16-Tisochrysis_lutea.AAC.1